MAKKMDPLKFAHDFEAKGTSFYLKLAFENRNKLAKELFYNLSRREIDHAQKLDELYQKAQGSKGSAFTITKDMGGIEKDLKSFFKKEAKKELKAGPVNIAGYKMAIAMEKKSIETYKSMAAAAGSAAEKKFFELLTAEEQEHYDALANVYRYLTNIGDWLEEDESKTWNWMNI